MEDLDPNALCEWYSEQHKTSGRENVQQNVTAAMICRYVVSEGMLPRESAGPFADYLHEVWNDYVGEGDHLTHRDLIESAVAFWRGD